MYHELDLRNLDSARARIFFVMFGKDTVPVGTSLCTYNESEGVQHIAELTREEKFWTVELFIFDHNRTKVKIGSLAFIEQNDASHYFLDLEDYVRL